MLPIKHKSIFKSRWIALLWAGGILWGACQFAGSQPGGQPAPAGNAAASPDGTDQPSPADVQAAAKALGIN